MKLPAWLRRTERRSENNYTDMAVQAALARATDNATATALLPVEAAVSFIERCFAVAEVSGLDGVAPSELGLHARRLVLRGESVAALVMRPNGTWRLDPASSWDIYGNHDPAGWLYQLNLPSPTGYRAERRPALSVAHFRMGASLSQPWRGHSPLDNGALTAQCAALLEASVKYELRTPVGRIISLPAGAPVELVNGLRRDLGALHGGISLPETTRAGFGQGMAASPARDYVPEQIGPAPSAELVELRRQLASDMVSAIGVPPNLCGLETVSEKDSRESYRRCLHTTIKPLGQIIADELTAKLMRPVTIGFDALAAADIAGRARAFKSLTEAGMSGDHAAALVGFDGSEVLK